MWLVVAIALGVAWYAPAALFRLAEATATRSWGAPKWLAMASVLAVGAAVMLWVEDRRLLEREAVESWHRVAAVLGPVFLAVGVANLLTGRCSVMLPGRGLRAARIVRFEGQPRAAVVGVARAAIGLGLVATALAGSQ